MSVTVRSIGASDKEMIVDLLINRWHSPDILIDGEVIDASSLPGFIAENEGRIVGLVTLIKRNDEWEILTLDSLQRWHGVGTLLLDAAVDSARAAGIARLIVRTSNDNLDAFRFYQRRGFQFMKIVQGVIDEERKQKPEIPVIGLHGIPIRDEVVFERVLS